MKTYIYVRTDLSDGSEVAFLTDRNSGALDNGDYHSTTIEDTPDNRINYGIPLEEKVGD